MGKFSTTGSSSRDVQCGVWVLSKGARDSRNYCSSVGLRLVPWASGSEKYWVEVEELVTLASVWISTTRDHAIFVSLAAIRPVCASQIHSKI